jgi:transcriptional regulator with XRE-family HTH domain
MRAFRSCVKDLQDLWDDAQVEMSEVIRGRRADLGMSQAQLAAIAGVDTRQIRRYESGEQQPMLSVAVAIAEALGITVGQLAGESTRRVVLTGDWWASWQTFKDGQEVLTMQQVRFVQRGDDLRVEATTRGLPVEDGGYLWRGEMRLWDNEILMGWYAADDQAIRSKGTMYLVLHPHGQSMTGRWVGLSYDGALVTGWSAMAKTQEEADRLMHELKERPMAPA